MTKLELKRLFSAWLDGKVIQLYEPNEKKWVNVKNPNWDTELEYRIKPKIELKDCNFNDEEYCTNEYSGVIKLNNINSHKIEHKKGFIKDKELAEAYAVLPQLIRLRDEYNEGWKPDWGDDDSKKYILSYRRNNIESSHTISSRYLLSFKSEEIRNQFLEDYKYLIEIAKPLL